MWRADAVDYRWHWDSRGCDAPGTLYRATRCGNAECRHARRFTSFGPTFCFTSSTPSRQVWYNVHVDEWENVTGNIDHFHGTYTITNIASGRTHTFS